MRLPLVFKKHWRRKTYRISLSNYNRRFKKLSPLAQQWILALEGEKYEQGHMTLRRGDKESSKYCCLGVLCDVADVKWIPLPSGVWTAEYNGEVSNVILPSSLREEIKISRNQHSELIKMNDSRNKTFREIALWLRKNLLVDNKT